MPVTRRISSFTAFAISSLLAYGGAPSTTSLDSSWSHYFNPDARYCVSYPSRWYKADAFDGSGLYVMAGAKKHARATGEIDVTLFPNPTSGAAHAANVSLKDTFDLHVEGLQKFERAERMEVLEQKPMDIAGAQGLFTKDRYYDPQDRSHWIEEVLFVQHGGDVYRLELECKEDQVSRFEPVFSHVVRSFQFDCQQRPSN